MFRRSSIGGWLLLCVFSLALSFIASTLYSRRAASEIDALANSISKNSAPSIVYLATITESIRLISSEAMHSQPEALAQSKVRIATSANEIDDALRSYALTDDYPGEHELYLEEEKQRLAFFSAVDGALSTVGAPSEAHQQKTAELGAAAERFAGTIRALTRLNADHAASEGYAIAEARRRVSTTSSAARAVTLLLALAGIVLASTASRERVKLVETSKRQAEARASELEMFAGRVAHDLRAPLTIIELKSSSGRRTDSVDLLHEALQRIARQGRRMSEIIDTLLAFAQSGARPGGEMFTSAADVVREVTSDHRSAIAESGIQLTIEPIANIALACSPSMLGVILSNLVRNAAEYHGQWLGRRAAHHGARPRAPRSGAFRGEDTGPGLPAGGEKVVFEPFVRLSASSVGGIGLGLATVKRLTEAHGGRVGVDSVPGRGCRFRSKFRTPPESTSASTARL